MLAMSPRCHSNSPTPMLLIKRILTKKSMLTERNLFRVHPTILYIVTEFQIPSHNTFPDMSYFLV